VRSPHLSAGQIFSPCIFVFCRIAALYFHATAVVIGTQVSKTISSFSFLSLVTGALAVMLAIGTGPTLPHGDQLLFSSARNWQDSQVVVYTLDMLRNLAQPLLVSRSDNLPGQPVVVSPDGRRIAYVLDGQHLQTAVLDFQDLQVRTVGNDLTTEQFNPVWSPDGRSLAYVGIQDTQSNIYVTNANGDHPRLLTIIGAGYKNLVWSPDGTKIAVEVGQLNEDIGVITVSNGRVTNITRSPERDIRPSWSPDGAKIAFLSSRDNTGTGGTRFDLYVVDADCNPCNPRRYTTTHPADNTWEVMWSPDSQQALFATTSWTGSQTIFLADIMAGTARPIGSESITGASPVWSPDGRQFAFESWQGGYWVLILANNNGQITQRFSGDRYDERRPTWSPNGRDIAYIANPDRNWDIYLMNVADVNAPILRLTHADRIDLSPIWRPTSK
jgi:Tol biopolymer transport system component